MIRIKLADNCPLDTAKVIQANYSCARMYSQRHPKSLRSTIQIRKGIKMQACQLYHVFLIIKGKLCQE